MEVFHIDTEQEIDEFITFIKANNLKCTEIKNNGELKLLFDNNEQFVFPEQYKSKVLKEFEQPSQYWNDLIFGKNKMERIVSVEPMDGELWIFTQKEDGKTALTKITNKYWMVAARQYSSQFKLLQGNQHFKYIREYEDKKDFYQAKKFSREYDAFTINDLKENALVRQGITYFKGLTPENISILSFDIESTNIKHNASSKVLLIANTFRIGKRIERKLFSYDDYETEKDMFEDWCEWVQEKDPSIVLGHNIFMFDLPYIAYCAKRCGARLELGRNLTTIWFDSYTSKFRKDGSQFYDFNKAHIFGREIIDTMFLSIKYDVVERKYESYALKQIIKQEGLEVKGRVFYDAAKIKDNYKKPDEWALIKRYAQFDSDDALALFDLQIAPYFYVAQSIPKSFQEILCTATGSQINSILIRAYLSKGYSLPQASETSKFQGANVFGKEGKFKNLLKIDVSSLYPSIILQYKLYNRSKDPDGYFLKMTEYFTTERLKNKQLAKETKNRYYKDLQEAFKIFINSMFGFCGAEGLLFNDPEIATFITKTGRWVFDQALKWATDKNFLIANGDTDSIMFCKADQSEITSDEQEAMLNEINSILPERIRFSNDGYWKAGLIVKAKNYVLFDGTKMKIKGSALRPANKEKALKMFMERLVRHLLNNEESELNALYNEYAKEILNLKDITRWSTKHTITDAVMKSPRANEKKVLDACKNIDIQLGDKIWLFFKPDKSVCLQEEFDGTYHKEALFKKLFDTLKIFKAVIDIKQFPNYSLKRNQKLLETL